MKILLIIVLSSTVYKLVPIDVPSGLTCADVYDKIIVYKKNPNYAPDTGLNWMNSFYKNQKVGGYICETL